MRTDPRFADVVVKRGVTIHFPDDSHGAGKRICVRRRTADALLRLGLVKAA